MDKHFIVLNGKRYDAVTGALLGPAPNSRTTARTHTAIKNPHLSRAQPSAKTLAVSTNHRSRTARAHHSTPKQLAHRSPEPAKTLMRRAVKKPHATQLPTTKRQYPAAKKIPGVGIAPKLSVNTINHVRMERAQAVPKSNHVERFSITPHPVVTPRLQPIAVAAAPMQTAHTTHIPVIAHTATEAVAQTATQVVQTASNIFEQAVANATSHEQPAPVVRKERSKAPRRLMSSLAALGAVVIIGGFLAYANKATVQLQVASVRAGFQASMPAYAPEGFERQDAKTKDGAVAINFVSPVNKQSFSLTQESSDWDSQTLFDSLVAQSNSSYQTVQSNGRTIYIYGNDQAAWVDGGILYKVSGHSGLNSDQIISLAASM